MRVVVLLKEVPDTYGDRALNLSTGLTVRDEGEQVLDEITERAVEAALNLPEAEVVVVAMGPDSLAAAMRKALAMGADRAVHVNDPALVGADLTLTAQVLAAVAQREEAELVIAGNVSTDGGGGVVPAMLAELLGMPHLTQLATLEVADGTVTGRRVTEDEALELSAPLPAVVSVTEAFAEARFPNFKGIMAAKKKPFDVLSLSDLGIDAEDFTVPRAIMTAVSQRPPREAGTKIVDDGDAAEQLAEYLVRNHLA